MIVLPFVIIATVIWIYLYYRRLNEYLKDLPTVWLNPFILRKKSFVEIFETLNQMTNNVGRLGKMWAGPFLVVFTHHPDDLKIILMSNECVERPYLYRLIPGGKGLLTAHADIWKPRRKQLNAAFAPSVLKSFIPIFNRKAKILRNVLDEKVNQPAFNISEYFFACNADAALEGMTGYESKMQQGEDKNLIKAVNRLLRIAFERSKNVFLHPIILYKYTAIYREQEKWLQVMLNYTSKAKKSFIVDNSMKRNCNIISSPDVHNDTSGEAHQINVLSILIRMKEQGLIDESELHDHINTMIVAATDTSALTLAAAVLMLAIYPEIQDQVYKEIENVCADTEDLDYDAISRLELMERVLKESLRLFPNVPLMLRKTCAEIKLATHTLPKDTVLLISPYKMHRIEEIWGPNANAFDPDNFLPDAIAMRHRFAFLPFSAGPRNCIGNKYAMISMKIQMSHLLRRYKFSSILKMSEIKLKFEVFLKVKNGYMVTCERRQ